MRVLDFLGAVYAKSRLGIRRSTLSHMELAVRQMEAAFGRQIAVEELSEELVCQHLQQLLLRQSAVQVNVRRGYFMAMWRLAYRKKLNANNPFVADVPVPRMPKLKPVAWSIRDIERMLAQAARIRPRGTNYFAARHWQALILLAYFTGLRIGAMLKLRRDALHGHMLFVPHDIQKDGEEMVFRLPDNVVNVLVAIHRPNRKTKDGRQMADMLIPFPWSPKYMQAAFTLHILKPAGLPTDRLHKFHAIRKTVATVAASKGGKIAAQELMGHSCMKVTEAYIADASLVCPSLKGRLSPMDVMPALHIG